MKKQLLIIFVGLFSINLSYAQGVCGTYDGYLDDDKEKYPAFYQSIENINKQLDKEYKSILSKMNNLKVDSASGKKIIPVVVHVIHDMGSENISDASIQGALDILNANINGQASNFLAKTPDVFAAVRGDLNVEFRLAKLDPDGNPTTGINRVRSSLTNEPEPRNAVKALSYWNSYQYFNIWTVKKFAPQADGNTLLGFAQFPWSGSMSTDGVVLLASQMVSGGTLTHETGHWLGLRHTWGDSDCGDDNVSDTPPAKEPNFGVNLSDFPHHVGIPSGSFDGCIADSLNWAGEMFVNYMDYSNDADVTMFTIGQNAVMNEVLEGLPGEFGYREYLWSESNLALTGAADGYKPPVCSQQASFNFSAGTSPVVCEGERVFLKGNKGQFGNGNVTSFVWDLGNGVINSSGDNQINYIYPNAGSYDVTLTVEYNEVTIARAYDLADLDITGSGTTWTEDITNKIVQGTEAELIAMGANNIIEISLDSLGVYFGMEDSSYFRGTLPSTIYTAYYNNSCSVSTTKNDFIIISPTSSTNNASSHSYSFESESESDWNIVPSSDIESIWSFNTTSATSWERDPDVADDGSASLKINGESMSMGSHEITSIAYDLSGITTPAIKFSWSGAAVNYFPANQFNVYYSTNCGEDWAILGSLDQYETANAGLYTSSFRPKTTEWRDTILTKSQLQNNNVRFKFEYSANDFSNNFYLDNVLIGDESSLFNTESSSLSRVVMFPNPTKGRTTIVLENLGDIDAQVTLVNILGSEVEKIFNGVITSKFYSIDHDLSKLDRGIYFIKVISEGNVLLTDKLILDK
tara:strand:- start:4801 stop:7218 length:2418 start_codon:yes stop_codon:yes gene_type:complete